MKKPKVAFVCTHNSCRSQMAEAIGRLLAADVFESYSAGTDVKPRINPDAVRAVKRLYGADMELSQRPKLISELPDIDVAVTMGCGVECPFLPCRHREDWGLNDPTGGDDAVFDQTAEAIRKKIVDLRERLLEDNGIGD